MKQLNNFLLAQCGNGLDYEQRWIATAIASFS